MREAIPNARGECSRASQARPGRTDSHAGGRRGRGVSLALSRSCDDHGPHPSSSMEVLRLGVTFSNVQGSRASGKSVLVTGGSRGIGRALVELFYAEGSIVTFFISRTTGGGFDVGCLPRRPGRGRSGGRGRARLQGDSRCRRARCRAMRRNRHPRETTAASFETTCCRFSRTRTCARFCNDVRGIFMDGRVSKTARRSSSSRSGSRLSRMMPQLFTRMSIPPHRSATRSTAAAVALESRTSTASRATSPWPPRQAAHVKSAALWSLR